MATITVKSLGAYAWAKPMPQVTVKSYDGFGWTRVVPALTAKSLSGFAWVRPVPSLGVGELAVFGWSPIPSLSLGNLGAVAWVRSANRPRSGPLAIFAWCKAVAQAMIGSAAGHAWTEARKAIPAWETGQQALWALFAASNQTINTASLSMSLPAPYSDSSSNADTQVSLNPIDNRYSGTVTLHYSRVPLKRAFPDLRLYFSILNATTISALLPSINSAYSLALVASDIVDGNVAAGATSVTLTAANTSYMYAPGTSVQLSQ